MSYLRIKLVSDMEKVSVIIPFYNYADWLEEAIESVVNQSYKSIEIIVVDDGSSEDISLLEKKYKNKVHFFHKENEGAASARNFGILKSTGKYIAFLDSDDIWEEDKISIQMQKLKDSYKDWVVSSYETFGIKSKKIVVKPPIINNRLIDYLYDTCKIQTSTIMVKKEVIMKNNIFFPLDMRKGQDIYVWYRLCQLGEYAYIEKPLVKFRIRDNNSYKSVANHVRTRALIWDKMNNPTDNLKKSCRFFTNTSYSICKTIVVKMPKIVNNDGFLLKLLYALPWIMFKFDAFLIKKGQFYGKK